MNLRELLINADFKQQLYEPLSIKPRLKWSNPRKQRRVKGALIVHCDVAKQWCG